MNIRKFLNINTLALLAIGLRGGISECGELNPLNLEEARIKKCSDLIKAEIEKETKVIELLINSATKKQKRHLAIRARKKTATLRKIAFGKIHADIDTKITKLEKDFTDFLYMTGTPQIKRQRQLDGMLLYIEELSQEISSVKTLQQANDVLQKIDEAINTVNSLDKLTQQQKNDFKFTLMDAIQDKAKHLTLIASMRKKRRLS